MARAITTIIGTLFFCAGLGLLGYALYFPTSFNLTTASAIQIQQVYSQATYYAVGGVGALLAAIICLVYTMGLEWTERARVTAA